ncbi:MAG TPA: hypothetical protein VF288_03650 [Mycobacteriales bacterium]
MTSSPHAAPAVPLPAVEVPLSRRRTVLALLLGVLLALAGAAVAHWLPRGWLLVVLLPAQLLLAVAWPALSGVPDRSATLLMSMGAALAADLLLTVRTGPVFGALAGVLGIAVVATVLAQLVRRVRTEVTDVLAVQCSTVLLVVMISVLAAVRGLPSGRDATTAGLLALAGALAAGGVLDLLSVRFWLGPAAGGRTLLGALVAVGVGAAVGAAVHGGDGLAAGVVAAALGVLGDLVVAVAAGTRRITRLLGAVLPFTLVGPGLYVVARVLFG